MDCDLLNDRLRERQEILRKVFTQGPLGLAVVGLDYRWITVNPALCEMIGYAEHELTNLTCIELTHPDDLRMNLQYSEQLVKGEISSYSMEKRFMRKRGEPLWVHNTGSIITDDSGKPLYFLYMVEDIENQKRSQLALRESEQRLRLIIDSAPVGIGIIQDGRFVDVNPAFATMFLYESRGDLVGLPAEILFAPSNQDLVRLRWAERRTGQPITYHYEATCMTRTGKVFEVGVWDTEIDYLEKRSLVVFVVDMSESKRLRSQLLQAQKMEAVGALAGGIAHDFNNLLTVVLGYSELIISQKHEKDPDYEDLTKIIYSARTAAELVRRILAFSRKTEAKLRPVDLNEQVELLQKILSRIISKNIKIRLNLDPALPTIHVDASQIDQVLMNLSLNARDAMAEGGTLTIQTGTVFLDESYCQSHIEAQEGRHVLLSVRDTGAGIDEESLEHIFEPFFSTKKPGEGTGLGLAMVYGIVKRHGGHIICESKTGYGSLFSIYLPVDKMICDMKVEESEKSSTVASGTILWVDDEELVRLLGQRVLEKEGYTVITAENGLQAIEIFRQRKDEISVVVLDLIMPVMDGKKCLHEILQIDSTAKVLIGTGFSPDEVTKEALEAGATGFVQKPYDFKKLLHALQEVLGHK